MIIIYYFLASILYFFGAIFLLLLSFKKKYHRSIPARFFLFNNPKFQDADVLFHACSFGEVQALKPLMQKFDSKAISVVTNTGFEAASKICSNTRFLPFEIFLPFWLKKSKTLVIFEAELWLMLVFVAKLKGSRVILINARISDRSYKSYLKFGFFYRYLFKFIDKIYAQSELDKERLKTLGAGEIEVVGNIKAAFLPSVSKIYKKPKARVIVLASTHAGEEEMILDNLNLKENDLLIIAPRHPERFAEVEKIAGEYAKKHDFSFAKFSQTHKFEAKVNLLDTLGELVNVYAISDIVVLGGSFVPNIGGHNPIECAQFNPVIISGEFIFNQKALFSLVENIYIAKVSEIGGIMGSDAKKSKIAVQASADAIIEDIRSTL